MNKPHKYINAYKLIQVLSDWQFLNAPFNENDTEKKYTEHDKQLIIYHTIGSAIEYIEDMME